MEKNRQSARKQAQPDLDHIQKADRLPAFRVFRQFSRALCSGKPLPLCSEAGFVSM